MRVVRSYPRVIFVGIAVILAAALFAPVVLFAAFALRTVDEDLGARASGERARAAFVATQLVERGLSAIGQDLRLFATRSEIRQGNEWRDVATIEAALVELLSSGKYSFIAVYDGESVTATTSSGSALRALAAVALGADGIPVLGAERPSVLGSFDQRASTDPRSQQGTGLGLALVKRFVELMGGSIAVTSTVGVGSTFVVRLPPRQRVDAAISAGPG